MCADIAKCSGDGCYLRTTCYRYTVEADEYWQSYFDPSPMEDEKCDQYLHNCKYVWRIGDSCSLNNKCKYPDCDEEGPLQPIYKLNNGNGATLCHHCRKIISTGKPTNKLYCKECQERRDEQLKKHKDILP